MTHGTPPERDPAAGTAAEDAGPTTPLGEAPAEPREHPENRPIGVTLVGLLYALVAVLLAVAGVATVLGGFGVAVTPSPALAGHALLAGALMILLGGFTAGIAYGLWNRFKWAWSTAIAVSAIGALLNLVGVIGGALFASLIGLAAHVVILWYLWQPVVRAWFGAGRAGPRAHGRPA